MKAIRFLHIPKTAGITFTAILKEQYQGQKHFAFTGNHASDYDKFQALSEKDRSNILLFTGHAPISSGIKEADEGMIITFLRDPISRVKSFCQHVSEGKSPYLLKDFPPERFSLEEFLQSGNEELFNLQTKMLVNSRLCSSPFLLNKMTASEARDMALEYLFNKISAFGLQEFFDESLILFAMMLNWSIPLYVSENRKSSTRLITFEQRHLDMIEELNSIDREVYKAARKKFAAVLNSRGYSRLKLKSFKVIQAIDDGLERTSGSRLFYKISRRYKMK